MLAGMLAGAVAALLCVAVPHRAAASSLITGSESRPQAWAAGNASLGRDLRTATAEQTPDSGYAGTHSTATHYADATRTTNGPGLEATGRTYTDGGSAATTPTQKEPPTRLEGLATSRPPRPVTTATTSPTEQTTRRRTTDSTGLGTATTTAMTDTNTPTEEATGMTSDGLEQTKDEATGQPSTAQRAATSTRPQDDTEAGATGLDIVVEGSTDADVGHPSTSPTATESPRSDAPSPEDEAATSPATPRGEPQDAEDRPGGVIPPLEDVRHNEVLEEEPAGSLEPLEPLEPRTRLTGPWLIGTRTAATKDDEGAPVLYRNYDVDSQERERELEERAREQYHPADLEDASVHEVNHFVPEDEQQQDVEAAEQLQRQQQRSVARWYLLLLAGNATTVRLRQKDFAKYLKLNLAARLSVEYDDLRVNRVEFKPLLMVNVTIFSRPKDNEEAPLHMLADTNATLLELSGEEYHVVRFLTIPNEHQEALASGGFQADSYTGAAGQGLGLGQGAWHVDMGVAVYFAVAAAFVAILLAVFLVGLWRSVRGLVADASWRPWRRYKPFELPRWNMPLQHRLCADHIVHCAPLRMPLRSHLRGAPRGPPSALPAGRAEQPSVWTTGDAVPVQKILAPEPPRRLVLTAEPGREPGGEVPALPPPLASLLRGDAAPSTADTLLQAQPGACAARPNSKLSLFGDQQQVVQPDRVTLAAAPSGRKRLQPQGRHPLDVRIHAVHAPRTGPTVLGVDNPNYLLQ